MLILCNGKLLPFTFGIQFLLKTFDNLIVSLSNFNFAANKRCVSLCGDTSLCLQIEPRAEKSWKENVDANGKCFSIHTLLMTRLFLTHREERSELHRCCMQRVLGAL